MSQEETTRAKRFSIAPYILYGVAALAALWACVFVPLLNPLYIKAFSNASLLHFYQSGSLLAEGATGGLYSLLLTLAAVLFILHSALYFLSLPSGKFSFVCRLIFILFSLLLTLVFIGMTVLMLIAGRFVIGGVVGAIACLVLAVIALKYRPELKPKRGKALRIVYNALAVALAIFCGVQLWLVPRVGTLDGVDNHDLENQRFDDPDITMPGFVDTFSGTRTKNVYTFILAGLDHNGWHTDNLMVARLNVAEGKLDIVNIPRDTLVYVNDRPSNYQAIKKINSAYLTGMSDYANQGKTRAEQRAQGVKLLRTELKTILGFVPDYYLLLNLNAFVELVDAIGGVDYYVKRDYNYEDPSQDLYIHLTKGQQRLSGAQAIQLVRYRHDYSDGDMGRINEAQDFMKAVAEQALDDLNMTVIKKLLDILENEKTVITDLSGSNLLTLLTHLAQVNSSNISFSTMPCSYISYKGQSYAQVKGAAFVEMINDKLNPYNEKITLDNLQLLIVK